MRGSAIIIAMLLITAVATVAFSIGRLFFIDSSLSNIYENSIVAYYGAESGIEEGMLSYRYNRDWQFCSDGQEDGVTSNRVNLTSTDNYGCTSTSSGNDMSINEQIYDLRMFYLSSYYGDNIDDSDGLGIITADDLVDPNYSKAFYIPYDESIKIDISNLYRNSNGTYTMTRDMDMYYVIDETNCHAGMNRDDTLIEAKVIGKTPSGMVEQKAALVTFDSALSLNDTIQSGYLSTTPIVDIRQNILGRIRTSTTSGFFLTPSSENRRIKLYLKPIGCSIKVGLEPDGNAMISSPFSTIKSTGYFGNVSRTLKARIDRQAGTVYDLFDFVILEH